MTPLLEFKGLCISLQQEHKLTPIVKDFNLTINAGEIVGLVGESGSGKSITALSILQLLPMPPLCYPKGEIWVDGVEVLTADNKLLRELRGQKVGCIFQEPMTSLNPLQTIEIQMSEVLFLHKGWSGEKAQPLILDWLNRVGVREPEKKLVSFPHQLSGGERQRVMIAMALLNKPSLLIADEPTTALDVTVQAQILALIKELQQEMGLAVLFISHDLGVVKHLSDRIAVMKDGQLVETGSVDEVFNNPQHPYTQTLINAEPSGAPVQVDDTDILLNAADFKVWFPIHRGVLRRVVDHVKAVDDVAFSLKRGHTLGVVGESGSGKSTLAKALLGLEKPVGRVTFEGQSLINLNHKQWQPIRKKIQVVFQDPYGSLSPRMSIEQIISEGLEVNRIGDKASRQEAVITIMKEVGLDPARRHRYPNEFSGGQRQRVAIARAMIMEPELVVLDEPTSSLDRTVQFQIIDLLKQLQHEKRLTYIFISHDLKVVKAIAHDVIVMRQGKIIEQGPEVFTNPTEEYTRQLVRTAFAY